MTEDILAAIHEHSWMSRVFFVSCYSEKRLMICKLKWTL